MRTWLRVMVNEGRPPIVEAFGSDESKDPQDKGGAVHTVTACVPIELPPDLSAALTRALAQAKPLLVDEVADVKRLHESRHAPPKPGERKLVFGGEVKAEGKLS